MPPLREQESIRIVVIDEEHLVRASLKALVTTWEEFLVVGEAASADEAVKELTRVEPDVVLVSVPGSDEADERTVHDIVRVCGSARLLVLIANGHEEFRSRLLRLGVPVLLKTQDPIEVQRMIRTIHTSAKGLASAWQAVPYR